MVKISQQNVVFKSIAYVVATVVALYLAWLLSDLIILTITAVMIAATLQPFIAWFEDKRVSRKLSAALVTIMLVLPIILVLLLMIPVFTAQIGNIGLAITSAINNYHFLPALFHKIDISQYTSQAGDYLWTSTKMFTNFFAELIILVFMIYYLLIDAESLYELVAFMLPDQKQRQKIDKALKEIAIISGQYIRGNIFISFICFSVTLIGLLFLHVPGAVALAVFAGVTDLLPLIGATIGSIPAIILAFAVSPMTGVLTIILFWGYQEFENDIIIPRVYHKALKIIPFLSFISVIIGTLLFGVAGAFLSLPIAASVPTIVHYFNSPQVKARKFKA